VCFATGVKVSNQATRIGIEPRRAFLHSVRLGRALADPPLALALVPVPSIIARSGTFGHDTATPVVMILFQPVLDRPILPGSSYQSSLTPSWNLKYLNSICARECGEPRNILPSPLPECGLARINTTRCTRANEITPVWYTTAPLRYHPTTGRSVLYTPVQIDKQRLSSPVQ
jgi:hypothetical protein